MQQLNVKIETAQKGVISTVLSLTNSNIRGIKMAKKYYSLSELSFQIKPHYNRFLDLQNQRFGRLTVLGYAGRNKHAHHLWFCECDCGNIVKVGLGNLRNGTTKSCGCYKLEQISKAQLSHGMSGSDEYHIYEKARARCNNPNNPKHKSYGGRGIEFRFTNFQEFFAEVGKRPSAQHSINRIDNNGHYEKGNLSWATPSQQSRNRRSNRFITYQNVTHCLAEWAEISGFSLGMIWRRLDAGWCESCSVSQPKGGGCSHK